MAQVTVMEDILGKNDRIAAENQALFADKKIFVINLMGSPGSGKTSLLERTMAAMKDKIKMAVIEGDLFTSKAKITEARLKKGYEVKGDGTVILYGNKIIK